MDCVKAVSYACIGLQRAAVSSGLPTGLFFAFFGLSLKWCKTCPYNPLWFCHCVHILQTVKIMILNYVIAFQGTTLHWETSRSISVISGYRLAEQYPTLVKDNDFLFVLHPHWLWEQPTHLLHGGYCSEIQYLMCGDDRSPPFPAAVQIMWNWSCGTGHVELICTFPCVFMSCCWIKHRD